MTRHLLVIGGQRCGSTTLHHLLDAHPDVTMARPARPEPKVFCSDEATDRGIEWYHRTWFGHARDGQLLGDKSTSYLEDAQAPARAARMLGTPDVVVVLRDPVDRAVSNWRFSTDNGLETRPLETALRESLEHSAPWDRSGTSVSPFAYLERGRYVDYLRPWREQFPDTTHVLFLAELKKGTEAVDRLFDALGVRTGVLDLRAPPVLNRSSETAGPSLELDGLLREYFAASDGALAGLLNRPLPWRQPTASRENR